MELADVQEKMKEGEVEFVAELDEPALEEKEFVDDIDAEKAKLRKIGLVYREDEPVNTGKIWVDGKEIWRVVYSDFGAFPNTTAIAKYLTSVLSSEIDTIVDVKHIYDTSSGEYVYKNSMEVYGSGTIISGVYLGGTYLGFFVNVDYNASGFTSKHFIVEYTRA